MGDNVPSGCVAGAFASGIVTATTVAPYYAIDGVNGGTVTPDAGASLVDGVVTAFDRIEVVSLASYALPYVLGLCKATGTCGLLRRAVVGQP